MDSPVVTAFVALSVDFWRGVEDCKTESSHNESENTEAYSLGFAAQYEYEQQLTAQTEAQDNG